MPSRKSERKTLRTTLDQYLAEISLTPLLLVEEEKDLGRRIQKGDMEALRKLVEANLRFVVKIAKRYRSSGVAIQDLINEGNLGLIEAARRYDPGRNVRFISYAVWWIRRTIQVAISTTGHPMRLPVRMSILLRKVSAIMSQTLKEEGRYPSPGEISKELGIDPHQLDSVLESARQPISLNKPMGNDGEMVLENLMTAPDKTEENMVQQSVQKQVQQALGDLAHKEEFILRLRFGFEGQPPRTLKQIGDQMGLSRERVRQIQQKALEKLRQNTKTRSVTGGALSAARMQDWDRLRQSAGAEL